MSEISALFCDGTSWRDSEESCLYSNNWGMWKCVLWVMTDSSMEKYCHCRSSPWFKACNTDVRHSFHVGIENSAHWGMNSYAKALRCLYPFLPCLHYFSECSRQDLRKFCWGSSRVSPSSVFLILGPAVPVVPQTPELLLACLDQERARVSVFTVRRFCSSPMWGKYDSANSSFRAALRQI